MSVPAEPLSEPARVSRPSVRTILPLSLVTCTSMLAMDLVPRN
jgi:hypothetical protein